MIYRTEMQRTASTSRPEASTDEEQTNEKTETPVAGWSECNVCFDVAKDPVVGSCGHLFCWPCIYQWLEARGDNATCPVCKAAIDKEHLVPIYGRGNESQDDPREKIPPRPQGQRQERESQHEGGPFGMEGFNISFGIGAFPIGLFAGPLYTVFGNNNVQQQNARRQRPEEQVLARIFMVFTLLMILWLLVS